MAAQTGLIITPGGTVELAIPATPEEWTLAELRGFIGGGHVQLVRGGHIASGLVMVVDEEGQLKEQADNPTASMIACQPVVGTVLLTPEEWIR